jgi:hypothetical protein
MNQRWYDQEPACPSIFKQIQRMPQPEMREFCARVLINVCEKLRKDIQHKMKDSADVSSLGVSAVTSRYGYGQYKRRWYDDEPVLHKAIGMLYSLPHGGLSALGFILKDTVDLIEVYAEICYQVEQPINMADISRITTITLQQGRKEAEEILIGLVGKDLYQSISFSVQKKR